MNFFWKSDISYSMNETLRYSVLNRVYLQIYGKEQQKLF